MHRPLRSFDAEPSQWFPSGIVCQGPERFYAIAHTEKKP
jgi:hypothetical protein